MVHVVLFHHAQGLTLGLSAFADRLRAAGHEVTTPDLFDGATFPTLAEGVAHAEQLGVDEIVARGEAAVAHLSRGLVFGGFSLGVLVAQKLAQNRPGCRAALLYESGVPLSALGDRWPEGVPLQIHAKQDDAWAEVDVLEQLTREVPGAELHLYAGDAHLFTDASLPDHDAAATDQVVERTLALLARLP